MVFKFDTVQYLVDDVMMPWLANCLFVVVRWWRMKATSLAPIEGHHFRPHPDDGSRQRDDAVAVVVVGDYHRHRWKWIASCVEAEVCSSSSTTTMMSSYSWIVGYLPKASSLNSSSNNAVALPSTVCVSAGRQKKKKKLHQALISPLGI